MKDRNKICIYYERANKCSKGKGCTIFGDMQHCGLYKADRGGRPLREDNRKRKIEKIRRKEKWN